MNIHQRDILYNSNFKNGKDRWRGYTKVGSYKVGHLTKSERDAFEAVFDFGGPPKFQGGICIKKRSAPKGFEWTHDPHEPVLKGRLSQLQIGRNAASIAQLHNTVHPILNEDWKTHRAQGVESFLWNTTVFDYFDERLVIKFDEKDHARAMNGGVQFKNVITVKTACEALADSMTALLKPENDRTVFQHDGYTDILRIGKPCTAGIISPFLRTKTKKDHQLSVYGLVSYVVVNESKDYDEIIGNDPETQIWNYAKDVYVGLFMMSLYDDCYRRSANYGLFDNYVAEFGTGKWASLKITESNYYVDIDDDNFFNDERCKNKLRDIHQSQGVKILFAPLLNDQRRRMSINNLYNSPQFHGLTFTHVLPIGNCSKNEVKAHQYEPIINLTAIWTAGRPSENPPLCQSCAFNHITRKDECYNLLIFMAEVLRHIKLYLIQSPFQNATEILTETNWKRFLKYMDHQGNEESVLEQNHVLSKMANYLQFSVPYLFTAGQYIPRFIDLKQRIKGFIFYKTPTIKRIENNENGVEITYVNQTEHTRFTPPTKKRRIIDDNELLKLLAAEDVNNNDNSANASHQSVALTSPANLTRNDSKIKSKISRSCESTEICGVSNRMNKDIDYFDGLNGDDGVEDEKEELSEDEDIDLIKPSTM